MTTADTLTAPTAPSQTRTPALPRRERRVSYCDIWDLVAPGELCPSCEESFEDRLARARGTQH